MELTRFANQKKKISKADQTIKPRALLPMLDSHRGVLAFSTFDIDDLDEAKIWALGVRELGRVRGRVDMQAVHYRSLDFTVEPDGHLDGYPDRHVSILGWPNNPAERLSLAQELSATMSESGSLHLPPAA